MSKLIKPWHGKLSLKENECPHCKAYDQFSDDSKGVLELSAMYYKRCLECKGEYVDTYLIVWSNDKEEEEWELSQRWDNENEDQGAIFEELLNQNNLIYDCDNPNEDEDYYNIPPRSVHFIKGEDKMKEDYYDNPKTDEDFIQIAKDVYGLGVRDNSKEELVSLGKDYHKTGVY